MIKTVVDITNSLGSLVPLGVIVLSKLPRLAMPGIEAPDGWCWFDPPYTNASSKLRAVGSGEESSLSPLLLDLSYLMERQYIRATYRYRRLSGEDVAILRVYIVPSDTAGHRFLDEYRGVYRRGKGLNWHEGKYKLIMKKIITVLDYSDDAWRGNISKKAMILPALQQLVAFQARTLGMADYMKSGDFSFHITRLVNGEPCSSPQSLESGTLEARLSEVYNSLTFTIDRTDDFLLQAQGIKGMRSKLYNYQMESVAKMLQNETQERYKCMPHILNLKRAEPVFFDTHRVLFFNGPELYEPPRGGILAENMGLGKTCICLALICLTKLDISIPPARFLGGVSKDYKVLSLMEQCVRHINRHSIPWRQHIDSLSECCVKKLRDNPGYFYVKSEETDTRRFSYRGRPIVREEKLLLATTTLIVCPDNLVSQWISEIGKHVEAGVLSVLELPSSKLPVPSPKNLIDYDIVLMSISSFVAQQPETSPLTGVYWKRFIIDEGHSMNQRSTKAVDLSKEIRSERRWAVTGTPTSGMTQLHMSEATDDDPKSYTVRRKYDAKDDLTRLGSLVYNFFQVEPWKSSHELWRKTIVMPFTADAYGSGHSLTSLLSDLVVRHSSEQIENDVTLPPLLHKPVFLTPSIHNRISVNLFTAVLAINAVSSEREDRDYMFHPASKLDLRRLVTNLQRSTFYWTGFSVEDLDTMIKISETCLNKRSDDGSEYYSTEDNLLLIKSIRTCKRALSDRIWRTVSTIHEMCYYIEGLHDHYSEYFSIGKYDTNISVLGAPQAYSMQKFYFRNRYLDLANNDDKISAYSQEFWREYWKEASRKNTERVKKNDGQPIDISSVDRELNAQEKISLKSSPKAKKLYDDVELIKSKSGRISLSRDSTSTVAGGPDLTKKSIFRGTASAKLSYLTSRLLEHQANGVKSIVFFEFEDSAFYISEALDLLGLDYTLYATSVPKHERPGKIDAFTRATNGHALIMDLKLASHGLTITAATRVYFINPVWSRSVEAQAIKRAHRIGQTEPVHVETLILKGTLEEEMFKRRQKADDSTTAVADDAQIQEFISRFEFLKMGDRAAYSQFKAPQTGDIVCPPEMDEDELLVPSGEVIRGILYWSIPVFNRQALHKMSSIQNSSFQNASSANTERKPKVRRQLQFEKAEPKRVRFA